MLVLALLALAATASAAHEHARRADWPSDAGAWTSPRGSTWLDVGGGGTSPYELGLLLGLRHAPTDRIELSSNLGRAGLGILDVHGEICLIDRGSHALGLSAGALWLDVRRARWMPAVDPDFDEALDGVDVLVTPLALQGSVEDHRLGVDLSLGWDHAWVTGRPSSEVLILDGNLGVRRLWTSQAVRLRLDHGISLAARATLPLYVRGRSVVEASYLVEEGIVAGVRSSDWFQLPAHTTATGRVYVEFLAPAGSLRLGAATTPLVRGLGLASLPYVRWTSELPW